MRSQDMDVKHRLKAALGDDPIKMAAFRKESHDYRRGILTAEGYVRCVVQQSVRLQAHTPSRTRSAVSFAPAAVSSHLHTSLLYADAHRVVTVP